MIDITDCHAMRSVRAACGANRGPGPLARSGYTLIEMVVVIGLAAAVGAMTLSLVSRLLDARQHLRKEYAWQHTLLELNRQVIADIHQAKHVVMTSEDEPASRVLPRSAKLPLEHCEIVSEHQSIRYHWQNDEIVRVVEADAIQGGRQAYSFPRQTEAGWSLSDEMAADDSGRGTMVRARLIVELPGFDRQRVRGGGRLNGMSVEIQAIVGGP